MFNAPEEHSSGAFLLYRAALFHKQAEAAGEQAHPSDAVLTASKNTNIKVFELFKSKTRENSDFPSKINIYHIPQKRV